MIEYSENSLLNRTNIDYIWGIYDGATYPVYLRQFMGRNYAKYK